MTIASEITRINNNIANAYTACNGKGATMPVTQNSANLADCIDSIQSGGGVGIPREVVNGVFQMPSSNFTFSLPSNVTDLGYYALYYAFYGCTNVIGVDLSSLTDISNSNAMRSTFYGCTNLISVDLSSLTTISGTDEALCAAFRRCASLTNVDLSSLTTINGSNALEATFSECISLTNVDLSSLTTINGDYAMSSVFQSCTGLTSVDLSSLTTISGYYAMNVTFRGCTSLTSLSFPALTSTSFGSYTYQFYNMLAEVTGCTVHFPSNLQSVIGSWSDVISGFGGTNTTVLFDLPATT